MIHSMNSQFLQTHFHTKQEYQVDTLMEDVESPSKLKSMEENGIEQEKQTIMTCVNSIIRSLSTNPSDILKV